MCVNLAKSLRFGREVTAFLDAEAEDEYQLPTSISGLERVVEC